MNTHRCALVLVLGLLGLALAPVWTPAQSRAEGRAGQAGGSPDGTLTVCLAGPPACDYAVIQEAVDAAGDGDVIQVAAGVYSGVSDRPVPAGYLNPPASGLITQVVYLSQTLTLQGGYTLTNWVTPDPAANPTTLDAEGQGRALVVARAIQPTISGLRFTGGDASGLGGYSGANWPDHDTGGGVLVISATATFSDNVVFGNTAGGYGSGGGMCLLNSDATIHDNRITSNRATQAGGAMRLYDSAALVSDNLIADNWATGAAGYGGAIHFWASPSTLVGNLITGNGANGTGGAIEFWLSDATLTNNVIAGNQAGDMGTAMYIVMGSTVHLLHNTLAHNVGVGASPGSGIYVDYYQAASSALLTDTILVSHTVGIALGAGNTARLEATLWANDTDWAGAGTILTGTVNLWGDPAFVDPDVADYHVGPASAAIDSGIDAGITTDLDGQPRPAGAGYDIGADEWLSGPAGLVATNDSPTLLSSPTTLTATVTAGSGVTYPWAFGDQTTGSGASVTHTYPGVGVYTAVVTASNPVGALTASTTVTITRPGFVVYLPVVLRASR